MPRQLIESLSTLLLSFYSCACKSYPVKGQKSAIWNEVILPVAAADRLGKTGSSMRSGGDTLVIHMLEVQR